jgi:hypothetical protein
VCIDIAYHVFEHEVLACFGDGEVAIGAVRNYSLTGLEPQLATIEL